MRRKRLAVLFGAAVLMAGGIPGAMWYRNSSYSTANLRFDSARWKASVPDFTHRSIRLRMADSLLRRHRLVGMSRAQIVDLLDEPGDSGGYFRGSELVYFLGLERDSYFAIDGEWLLIDLDEHGMATEARLATD